MKIKIYCEDFSHNNLRRPLAPMIAPFFLTKKNKNKTYSWHLSFELYWEMYNSIFQLSSLCEADIAVLPYDWFWVRSSRWLPYGTNYLDNQISREIKKLSIQYYQKVREKNKPVVIFFSGDRSHEKLPFKEAIVFREGIYQSKRKSADFVLPAFSEDLVKNYLSGEIIVRTKNPRPTVGFCGLAKGNDWSNFLKLGVYHSLMLVNTGNLDVSPYKGEILRTQIINNLVNQSALETNFLIRTRSVFLGNKSSQMKQKSRLEYIDNMVQSDYILCCRGSGNYSFRLYETLCMGRIPIFVNTDCGLPYDFILDWKKYVVWIEENEIESLPSKLLEFHNSLSEKDFVDLQYECRNLWLKWLSPEGFFSNFYRHFEGSLSKSNAFGANGHDFLTN